MSALTSILPFKAKPTARTATSLRLMESAFAPGLWSVQLASGPNTVFQWKGRADDPQHALRLAMKVYRWSGVPYVGERTQYAS